MTTRSSRAGHVSTTDVLIAMLSSDLRGSWAEPGFAIRSRAHRDPAAGAPPAIEGAGSRDRCAAADADAGSPGRRGVTSRS